MTFILLGIVGVFAFLLLMKLFWARTQPKLSPAIVVGLVFAMVGGLGALVASGKLHWLIGSLSALLPFLRRGFGLLRFAVPGMWQVALLRKLMGSGANPFGFADAFRDQSPPDQDDSVSHAESEDLSMQLDHATQELDGTVKRGKFAGRLLSSMSKDEILELNSSFENEDSKRLLMSYIEHRYPDASSESEDDDTTTTEPEMAIDQAYAILGLEVGASIDDINDAHKRLMQRMHPDRGGSNYLAAEVNQARQVLVDHLGE